MLKISYKIKIGNITLTEAKPANLLGLRSHAALDIPVNSCQIILGLPQDLTVAPDDSVSVELGYDQTTTLVFTGKLTAVDSEIARVRLEGVSALESLTLAHFNLFYEKPNAGEIVQDILKKGKLQAGKLENGLKFASYTLGDRLSASDHLQKLAQQCGFDLYANAEDKIVFAPYQAANSHEFNYGENILASSLEQPNMAVEKVEIYGESPASQGQGEKASSWLTKKEVKGVSGDSSGVTLRLSEPTARNQAIAEKMAQGILANLRQKQRGRVKVLGNPLVQLGDEVKLAKMPLKQQNGTFKVIGVGHRLNRRSGFYTVIDWEES